jgi:hypothetical protein
MNIEDKDHENMPSKHEAVVGCQRFDVPKDLFPDCDIFSITQS